MNVAQSFSRNVQAYHAWRLEANALQLTALVLGWAGLMGLLAQLRVPLPFTPVPFTMQVFGVLLAGILLGSRHGALAQVAYVGIGAAGMPWFQNLNGGAAYLMGATGGYLVAMPLATWAVGRLIEMRVRHSVLSMLPPMTAGVAIIYSVGVVWLAAVLTIPITTAVAVGVAPFVPLDVAKAIAAAAAARSLVVR